MTCAVNSIKDICGSEAADFMLTLSSKMMRTTLDFINCVLNVTGNTLKSTNQRVDIRHSMYALTYQLPYFIIFITTLLLCHFDVHKFIFKPFSWAMPDKVDFINVAEQKRTFLLNMNMK